MKKILFTSFLILLIAPNNFGQEKIDLKFLSVYTDTTNTRELLSLVRLRIEKRMLDDLHAFKIMKADVKVGAFKKLEFDEFYSTGAYEIEDSIFDLAYIIGEKPIKLKEIKGVLRYFHPSYENGSIIKIDSLKAKKNSIVFENGKVKVVLIDLADLYHLKQQSSSLFESRKDEIISKNKINERIFKELVDGIFSNYNSVDEYMFYAEDPENIITSIDITEGKKPSLGGTYVKYQGIKIFKSNKKLWPFESAKIFLENENSIKDYLIEIKLNGS